RAALNWLPFLSDRKPEARASCWPSTASQNQPMSGKRDNRHAMSSHTYSVRQYPCGGVCVCVCVCVRAYVCVCVRTSSGNVTTGISSPRTGMKATQSKSSNTNSAKQAQVRPKNTSSAEGGNAARRMSSANRVYSTGSVMKAAK
ncbi:MAG: hypothetical protein P4L40_17365, partial [Terracidiphilus sp.]|nr:hypothetical protein [Terracidiphilus sp.]